MSEVLTQSQEGIIGKVRTKMDAKKNSRVKIMSVVSPTKMSHIFPVPQDPLQPEQAHLVIEVKDFHFYLVQLSCHEQGGHLVIDGETDFLFSCSLFPLGFQSSPVCSQVLNPSQFQGHFSHFDDKYVYIPRF